MTRPTEMDSPDVLSEWNKRRRSGSSWMEASIEDVKQNMLSTGYPTEQLHFIKGDVQETIPATVPDRIALLRLDTDWYASTLHELQHLYPLLVPGGVLIIDDYGHFDGARQAVDEYFAEQGTPILLHRLDYTGRMIVKQAEV
jgi:O-methyltransferase